MLNYRPDFFVGKLLTEGGHTTLKLGYVQRRSSVLDYAKE